MPRKRNRTRSDKPSPLALLAGALAASVAFFLCPSCSQSSPTINAVTLQALMAETDPDSFEPRLSVFVFWDDGDGARDFSSIRVVSDDTSLKWTIDASNAAVRLRGKDRWVGSSLLAPPLGEAIPAGSYTVTVTDLAGNEATRPVTLPAVAFPERSPARLRVSADQWTLERNSQNGDFTRVFFLLEDDDGKALYSWRVPDNRSTVTTGTVAQLKAMARNATRVRCYVENGSGTAGVLLSPVEME